jgi:putative tricarboxylic transport membrane protein
MLKKTLQVVLIVIFVAAVLILVTGRTDAQTAYPSRPIQLVAAGGPGSGVDLMARSIEQAMTAEKLIDQPFMISNKSGGSGNATTSYLVEHKGNGNVLGTNSNRFILNKLLGSSEYGLQDITTVARLVADYPVWIVRADSKYNSAMDVLADLKKNPKSVIFGITSMANNDHFNILRPAKQQGIDYTKIEAVVIPGGNAYMSQLLGGHIPIVSVSMSETVAQVTAGKIRMLSIASENRIDRFPNVPTWRDLGIDVVIPHWRGVFAPPDMPKVAFDYWNKKLAEMVKTKTWKDILTRYQLFDSFQPGDSFKKQLDKDELEYTEFLKSLGMLNKEKKQP